MSTALRGDPRSPTDRKIPRRHGRSRDPLPEFVPLRSSPAQPDQQTLLRFLRRARPETAWSWCRNFLSIRLPDSRPSQKHSESSIDRTEAASRRPPPNPVLRTFPWSEIHLDNDAVRWLPRSCIPPRRPRDKTASTLYLKSFDAQRAPGRREVRAR